MSTPEERIAARAAVEVLAGTALFHLREASGMAMRESFNVPIVADIIERAIAEEREACAAIADVAASYSDDASLIAEAIRARGTR